METTKQQANPSDFKRAPLDSAYNTSEELQQAKEALTQNAPKLKTVIIVETIKTLVKEDVGVNKDSAEELQKLTDFLGFPVTGETKEEFVSNLKAYIDQNIDQIVNTQNNEIYFEYFNQKMPVYNFTDFGYGDDVIPKKSQKEEDNLLRSLGVGIETLGTGEYAVDEDGKEIPHDLAFVKDVLLEMIHFQAHTQNEIYNPSSTPNISLDWFNNERIYVVANLKDQYEWVF